MAEPLAGAAGGGGDWKLATICLSLLVGVFGALAFLLIRWSSGEGEKPADPAAAGGGGQRRRGALDRMQRGVARGAGAAAGADEGEDDEDEDGDRATRRNAQKQAKKQERRDQQQADRQARQQQDSAKSEKQKKYDLKQQDKEAERQRKEDQEKKEREDKEKREQDEFAKWKEMFAVEAEGEDDDGTRDESAVERFVQYVKRRKVVNLEDLAAEFRMRTSSAIDRLEQLEKLGRLSGIFDDRGKYVYITAEEMAAVADWLRKKGRINRPDLVAACNRLIRLDPTASDREALEREAKSAAACLEEGAEVAAEGGADAEGQEG
mmetsp:Transcript_37627/g.117257  ORF Transcript_37627/g.117257 Transcript_37627/m.117257 type:complete len:321 (+) Transcript_37627:134-1096(+)